MEAGAETVFPGVADAAKTLRLKIDTVSVSGFLKACLSRKGCW